MEFLAAIRDFGLMPVAVVVLAVVVRVLFSKRESDRVAHATELGLARTSHATELGELRDNHATEVRELRNSHELGMREMFKQIAAEQNSRLEDAKRYTDASLEIHNNVNSAIDSLSGATVQHERLTQLVLRLVDGPIPR